MAMVSGLYYVGDLCYVLKNQWEEVCGITIVKQQCLEGQFVLPSKGVVFAMYGTAYGDGEYKDTTGRSYCVDSGSIGCIPLSACDMTEEQIREEGLGQVLAFGERFNTYSDGSTIHFGTVSIDTGYTEEEDEDPSPGEY